MTGKLEVRDFMLVWCLRWRRFHRMRRYLWLVEWLGFARAGAARTDQHSVRKISHGAPVIARAHNGTTAGGHY